MPYDLQNLNLVCLCVFIAEEEWCRLLNSTNSCIVHWSSTKRALSPITTEDVTKIETDRCAGGLRWTGQQQQQHNPFDWMHQVDGTDPPPSFP